MNTTKNHAKRAWYFLPGAMLLIAFGMINALDLPVSHHLQFLGFIAAILLILQGLSDYQRTESFSIPIPRWEWFTIGGITLFALLLRGWRLGSLHVLVDETNFLDGVMHFWDIWDTPMLGPMAGVAPFTRLHAYTETWTVALFGRNLVGFRMASAVIGALNVTAVWWLARHLFTENIRLPIPSSLFRTIPMLAALILATFPPHLHFSRLALNNISDPLFGTLALGFMARARLTHHLRDFVLAGIMLGLTHYFHNAGQLFWMGLVALWILWDVMVQQRRQWRGFGYLVLASILIMLPVYIAWASLDLPLLARFDEGRLSNTYWHDLLIAHDSEIIKQHSIRTMRAFLIYVHIPDETIFYAGKAALVIPLLLPPLFYGFWLCLWRGSAMIALWPLLVTVGSSLLRDSATSTRFLPAFPALAILIAVGLCGLIGLLLSIVRVRYTKPLPVLTLVGLAIVIYQVNYYVNGHLPTFNVEHRERRVREDIEDALIRLAEDQANFQPGTTHAHFVTFGPVDYYSVDAFLSFLADDYPVEVIMEQDLNREFYELFRPDFEHAVFVLPDNTEGIDLLLEVHPYTEPALTSPYWDYAGEQFLLYRVPPVMDRPSVELTNRPARHERELPWMTAGLFLMLFIFWRHRS